ncbi:MAG: MBL fold metallo-hydrolase [Oscillospiraceae bacterium]|nr:MBL fold metallo-hydrolase [Oscillospiraceae bacterium]
MEILSLSVGMMPTNCYLAAQDGRAAVIDPGAEAERILSCLAQKGWQLDMVLLTHGHFDHVGAVNALQKAGARVGVAAADEIFLRDPERAYAGLRLPVGEELHIRPDFVFHGGETLKMGDIRFQVLSTPGHSAGSVCFLCPGVIFSGDTLFCGGCGRTDLFSGSWTEMRASLKKLAALPGDYRVLPGHGEETTLEYERKNNQLMGADDHDFDY